MDNCVIMIFRSGSKIICPDNLRARINNIIGQLGEQLGDTINNVIELETNEPSMSYESAQQMIREGNGFVYNMIGYLDEPRNFIFGNSNNPIIRQIISLKNSASGPLIFNAMYDNALGRSLKGFSRNIIEDPEGLRSYAGEHYQEIINTYYGDFQLISSRNMARVNANNWIWSIKYQGLRVNSLIQSCESYPGMQARYFTQQQINNVRRINNMLLRIQEQKINRARTTERTENIEHEFITAEEFEQVYANNSQAVNQIMRDVRNCRIFSQNQINEINNLFSTGNTRSAGLKIFTRLNEYLSGIPQSR